MSTQRIVFVGVGGQGNLLASNLLGQAALAAGQHVVVSEIHGMAQRGGVVESAVILGDATSPIVSDGEADVVVSFEPVEALRNSQQGQQGLPAHHQHPASAAIHRSHRRGSIPGARGISGFPQEKAG